MKVLSLFDGCAGARQALKNLNVRVDRYHAYELDKYAIKIAHKNHPDLMSMGAITPEIEIYWYYDLLIGGSPCQDLSIAKSNRKGLDGERSGLFWQYVRILKMVQPKYFLLENVASMSKESKQIITDALGVEPIMINSALLTAQNRKRLYWTNIPGVTQPEDKGILLKDIIEQGYVDRDKSLPISATEHQGVSEEYYLKKKRKQIVWTVDREKSYCLDANYHKGFPQSEEGRKRQGQRTCVKLEHIGNSDAQANCITSVQSDSMLCQQQTIRKLTPVECERLQGYPDNYSEGVSNTQRYKMMGNSFTVPVIEHILGFMEGLNAIQHR